MGRAIDSVSGRITEPYTLTEENAWVKRRRYNWNRNSNEYFYTYLWRNVATDREIPITEEEFNNQIEPNL